MLENDILKLPRHFSFFFFSPLDKSNKTFFVFQSLGNSPVYSKSQKDSGDVVDVDSDSKDFIKAETQQLLADGKNHIFMLQ